MTETKTNQTVNTQTFAHKGEVVLNFSISITQMFLPPAAAREIAKGLIMAAEQAEQQMDEERE